MVDSDHAVLVLTAAKPESGPFNLSCLRALSARSTPRSFAHFGALIPIYAVCLWISVSHAFWISVVWLLEAFLPVVITRAVLKCINDEGRDTVFVLT